MIDIESDPAAFVVQAHSRLSETADRIDRGFPENEYAVFHGEDLVIRKHRRRAPPDGLAEIDKQLSQNMPEKNILDILVEAENGWASTNALGHFPDLRASWTTPYPLCFDLILLWLQSRANSDRAIHHDA